MVVAALVVAAMVVAAALAVVHKMVTGEDTSARGVAQDGDRQGHVCTRGCCRTVAIGVLADCHTEKVAAGLVAGEYFLQTPSGVLGIEIGVAVSLLELFTTAELRQSTEETGCLGDITL